MIIIVNMAEIRHDNYTFHKIQFAGIFQHPFHGIAMLIDRCNFLNVLIWFLPFQ